MQLNVKNNIMLLTQVSDIEIDRSGQTEIKTEHDNRNHIYYICLVYV